MELFLSRRRRKKKKKDDHGDGSVRSTGTGAFSATTATITNTASGTISGSLDGIRTSDTATITNAGTITGTTRNGIRVGKATITNTGTISGVTGIVFRNNGFGASGSVFNAGTITGTGGTAINFAFTPGTGPYTLTIAPTSVINGKVLGTGTDTFQLGGSGIGSFDVGSIGATQQYQGFATFNKISDSTWTLTGSGAQNWTISQGTLIGDSNSLGGSLITDNAALIFDQAFDGTHAGVIAGSGTVTKQGAGTLIISAVNTYSGGTNVLAGILQISGAGTLGATTAPLAVSGGALDLGGTKQMTGPLTLTGGVIQNGELDASAFGVQAGTISAVLGGTGGLTKTGTGAVNLTGTDTYTGGTTIAQGLLSVNGSLVNSIVTIQNGGTLGGNGTVKGIMAQSGGTVAPGNSIGTLNVSGNVAFAAGSIYQVEINAAGQSDKIIATGTATLSGGTVQVHRRERHLHALDPLHHPDGEWRGLRHLRAAHHHLEPRIPFADAEL